MSVFWYATIDLGEAVHYTETWSALDEQTQFRETRTADHDHKQTGEGRKF